MPKIYDRDRIEVSRPLCQASLKNATGDNFLNDFYSKIWFSYRKNFKSIRYFGPSNSSPFDQENSQLTSDVGWGCVIRCTQMLMAQALVVKLLGRGWRKLDTPDKRGFNSPNYSPVDRRNNAIYSNILSWFLDVPGISFSIHTLCELIVEELKCDSWQPGSWLGPATAANIVQQAVMLMA